MPSRSTLCKQHSIRHARDSGLASPTRPPLQVGLVQLQQPFPVWVQGQVPVHIRATAMQPPAQLAWLGEGTELHIAPRPRSRPQKPAGKVPETAGAAPTAPVQKRGKAVWLRVQVRGWYSWGHKAPLCSCRMIPAGELRLGLCLLQVGMSACTS